MQTQRRTPRPGCAFLSFGLLRRLFCGGMLLLAACDAQAERLDARIDHILSGRKARIGLAIRTPEGATVTRNDTLLPLMSVFKFPVALAVLDRLERGGIPLAQPLRIAPERLVAGTYSPMRDSLPASGGTLDYASLLHYVIVRSDNIACDILLDDLGGPQVADAYVRSLGIDGIRIVADEAAMHRHVANQRLNRARPSSVCALFDLFLRGGTIGGEYRIFLDRLLRACATGADKLRAGLPAGTAIGHKTGSSDRTPEGIRIADNDAGYVSLPDGRSFCIAVFVTESAEDDATNAAIAAAVCGAAYECLTMR